MIFFIKKKNVLRLYNRMGTI